MIFTYSSKSIFERVEQDLSAQTKGCALPDIYTRLHAGQRASAVPYCIGKDIVLDLSEYEYQTF